LANSVELLNETRLGVALSSLCDKALPLVQIEYVVDVIRPVRQREDESPINAASQVKTDANLAQAVAGAEGSTVIEI